jgi:inner membrane protein involved in colicin E2 resistance
MEVKDFYRLFDAVAKAKEYRQYKSDIRGDLYLFEQKLNKQAKQILKLYRACCILVITLIFMLMFLFFYLTNSSV